MKNKSISKDDNKNVAEVNKISESIKNYGDHFEFYSGEASKIARQLAFIMGAIVWLLYSRTDYLYKALISINYVSLVLFFIFDLIQYLFGAFKFSQLANILDNVKKQNPEPNLQYQYSYNFIRSLHIFYIIKFIFIGISAIALLIFFSIFLTYPSSLSPPPQICR